MSMWAFATLFYLPQSVQTLSQHISRTLSHRSSLFPLCWCLWLLKSSFMRHFVGFCVSFSVCMQAALIKCLNACFASSRQDSDGAFEAARRGRSGGWNWGSSSDRDQWHLSQGAALQQRSVPHVCLCICMGLHASTLSWWATTEVLLLHHISTLAPAKEVQLK